MDTGTVNGSTFAVRDETGGFVFISGTYAVSADSRTVTFVPVAPLAAGHTFRVFLSGTGQQMTDYAGNALANQSYTFTASSVADTTTLQVLQVSPRDTLTQAPTNSRVTLLFNKPVAAQSILNAAQNILTRAGIPVPVFVGFLNSNQEVVLTPVNPLASNSTYTITVAGIQDVAGNAMTGPVTTSFTTGTEADLIRPGVTLVDPVNGAAGVETNALIRLQFSERIDPVSVNNGTIQVWPNSTGVPISGTATASADRLSASFLASPLFPSTAFTVRVNTSGITDLAGNGINFFQSGFTTGTASDTDVPTGIIFVSPQDGAAGVPVNARISVQFSEPMSSVSMLSNPVTVIAAGGATVAGSIGISSDHTAMTLFPSSPLAPSTSYKVHVSGVQDVSGSVAPPFTSSFTTAASTAADLIRPSVISVSPANGAGGVAANSTVVWTFSEPVDPTTVNINNIFVFVNNTGVHVAGTYAVNGAVVRFTPATSFVNSTGFSTQVNGGVLDLAGNTANFIQTSFTTAGPSSSITNAPPPLRPVNATLDSTNPLSTGLMGLFLMNEGNGSTDKNLVNSKLAAFAGTNVPTWNFADPSMVFNGGGSLASYLDAGTDLAFDQLPTSQ